MTHAEVDRVVRILTGAWGYFAAEDTDRVALWTEHIERMDFEPTRAATKRLVETCDRLPSLAAFLAACRDEARFARLAAAAPTARPGEDTYACRCGEGRGWVVVAEGDPPTVEPCRTCRPATYETWVADHYGPTHDRARCAECCRVGRAA